MIMKRNSQHGAFLLFEVLMATLLAAGIIAVFALALVQFAGGNDLILTKQRAVMAADGAMNNIRAGHEPTAEEFSASHPNMSLQVQRQAGTGPWEGLTRVTVRVETTARGNTPVRVRLDGYLPEAKQ